MGSRNSAEDAKYLSMTVPLRWLDFRTFQGGQMKMLDAFPQERLKPLLPLKVERPDESCIRHRAMPTFLPFLVFLHPKGISLFSSKYLFKHRSEVLYGHPHRHI
jgi:hypothetical protein